MSEPLTLANEHLSVVVDTARGADILSLKHRARDLDVLFSTPWRARADQVRAGATPTTYDPVAGPLEQYAGGWQTLCPNAGPPRVVAGAPVGFHGEAWLARWDVVHADPTSARLRTELFAVPMLIERLLTLDPDQAALTVADTLTNLSDVELEIDYVSHPAFAGRFLDGECVIDSGARRFTADPGAEVTVPPDLRPVPPPGERRMLFGWLSDFEEHWASITNADLGFRVRLDWEGTYLPYAWLWQELNWTEGFPWFRRARVMAIEPSSTPTSGPERRSVLRLAAHQSVDIPVSITLEETKA